MTRGAVLVTGINGFVGHHLARELYSCGYAVIGVGKDPGLSDELVHVAEDYVQADLAREWPTTPSALAVVHLAGLAAVGPSFDEPQEYITANSAMVTNMCEYFLSRGESTRLLGISSGAVYSPIDSRPVDENAPVVMSSPYVVSKVLVENQFAYYANRGMDCLVARPFNHVGPGQRTGFIVPDLIARVREATRTGAPISVGNLMTARDYTDVRDVAVAYRMLATAAALSHRLYNVCSGEDVSGTEILAMILAAAGQEGALVEVDESLFRPTDAATIRGDSGRLRADLGWSPRVSLRETIQEIVTGSPAP